MTVFNPVSKLPVQAKLTIGQPGDRFEQEADAVADQVMRMPASQIPPVQRKCEQCEEEEEGVLQMKGFGESDASMNGLQSSLQKSKGNGQHLDAGMQSFMGERIGADFSKVKVHTDSNAIQMNRQLNAKAFTNGSDVYFNQGQYNPQSSEGKHLLAHELTHVVQQGDGAMIQRAIAPDQIATTPVSTIMADETYFENNITNIQFYEAQLAILHYADGTQIRLGLVPDQMDSSVPISGVDYITPARTHIRTRMNPTGGNMTFIPRGQDTIPSVPPGTRFGDVIRDYSEQITFSHDPGSGRIVPSIVNQLTAPRLSEVLVNARDEYARNFDAMAAGAVEVLEQLEIIVILASLLPSGGTSASGLGAGAASRGAAARGAAARGAATATSGIMGRATSRLLNFFNRLLRSSGARAANITVEGVSFGGVRVAMEGTELVITRGAILNSSRLAGQGRLIQAAYEQAAIAAARQAGATTVSVRMHTVVNATWRTYMESQGYAMRFIEHGSGGTNYLMKVFTL